MWFFQLETWFNRRKIANDDAAKYDTLIGALDTNLLTQVSGALRNVIPGNKYEPLKRAIIDNFADSETQQLRKLLGGIPRGNNKPTALLNIMRNTCKNPNTEQVGLIRHFWLEQMPKEVRAIIVANKAKIANPANVTLDDEAKLADAILESLDTTPTASISEVSQAQSKDTTNFLIEEITKKFNTLFKKFEDHRSRSRSRSHSKSKDRNKSKSAERKSNDNEPKTCVYHRKYGMDAKKCKEPCNFHTKSKEQSKNQ